MRIAEVVHTVVISKQPRRFLFVGGAGVAQFFRICFCVAAAETSIVSLAFLPEVNPEPSLRPAFAGAHGAGDIFSRLQLAVAASPRAPKLSIKVGEHVPFPAHGQGDGQLLFCFPVHTLPGPGHAAVGCILILVGRPASEPQSLIRKHARFALASVTATPQR